MENEDNLWNKVLTTALKTPGVRVNRDEFLRKELNIYYKDIELENILSGKTKIAKNYRDRIANGCIKHHLTVACSLSAIAGVPGGWAMLGAVPADIAQFYAQVLILTQKMLYLYGWQDLRDNNGQLSDEALNIVTLWIGMMMGCQAAQNVLKTVLTKAAEQALVKIPKKAFGHAVWYTTMKQVAKWIGVSLTKTTTARAVSKLIPLIGAPISASLTYTTFKPMARKLKESLDTNCAN